MKKYFFWTSVITFLALGSCKSLMEKGENQFLSGEYHFAISTFGQILKVDSTNLQANRYLAESFRLSNRIEKSEPYYRNLVEQEPTFNSYYFLGQSLKAQERNNEAKDAFEKAKSYTSEE